MTFRHRGALGLRILPVRPSILSFRSKFKITRSLAVRLVLWGLLSLLRRDWYGLCWRGVRAVILVGQLELPLERIDRILIRRQGLVMWR